MNKTPIFGMAAAAAIGASAIWLVAAAPGSHQPQAWEYKVVQSPGYPDQFADVQGGPNQLGADGWELVSVTALDRNCYFSFKRLKHP